MQEEVENRTLTLVHSGTVDPSQDNMLKIVRCYAQKCISPAGGHY